MLAGQEFTHAWLPAEATRGAAIGQQIVPEMTFPQVALQVYAVVFRYYLYGQFVASGVVSHTVIQVLFTWLVLTRPQEVTQDELDL